MSQSGETRYRYFSLDSDHDLSTDTLELSLDGVSFTATSFVSDPPPEADSLAAPAAGLTRYWWRILVGPAQTLKPSTGVVTFYGRLVDNPETLLPAWEVFVEA